MPPTIDTIPVANLPASGSENKPAFQIPAYQRGYRWKSDDVKLLLKDLTEFLDEARKENEASKEKRRSFYCLQPLVVKKATDKDSRKCWEVVDGQQRLTTLFLLWKVLDGQPSYSVSYVTRKRSEEFLSEISQKTPDDIDNIDFHHIYHAHEAVKDWFKDKDSEKERFKELLSGNNPDGREVRFIWYELDPDDDAVAAFTRLNVGKISLTDEELIRALFLQNSEGGEGAFQHRLALEWDRIETALQEPDFWGFVSNQPPPEGGRIRLLFELDAGECDTKKDHWLFRYYEDRLKHNDSKKLEAEWRKIVACFEQLEEWYRDPELFHLVGYRATILGDGTIPTLRKLRNDAKSPTKSDFAAKIRKDIRTELIRDNKQGSVSTSNFVSGLSYTTKNNKTLQTLALFNIATILRTQGVRIRFPFHLYHDTKNGWDIEHVQSQAGDDLKERSGQEKWLEACKPELEHDAASPSTENGQEGTQNEVTDKTKRAIQLIAEIDEFIKLKSSVKFPELEKKIRQHFGETESTDDEINDIGNLTLLDAPTNRGYGNAPFVVKRTEILKPKRPKGTFILPCTRDLFLKVFSKNAGNLRRWDIKNDGAAHKAAICETLKTFFGE